MKQHLRYFLFFFLINAICCSNPEIEEEELRARDFLRILDKESSEDSYDVQIAEWAYMTNLTEVNLRKKIEISTRVANNTKRRWQEVIKFNWNTFTDPLLKRQFKMYSNLETAALSNEDYARLEKILGEMEKAYSTNTVCDFKDKDKCNLNLEPEITKILVESRNEPELRHMWLEWRNGIGPNVRNLYRDYVHLMNKAAHLNKFENAGEMWLENYEDKNIRDQFHSLWDQVRPLYLQLHAYTRYKLRKLYGDDVVSEKGPIPAHLLGNMWAQTWETIAQDFLPYPNKQPEDITKALKEQNYTVNKIFRTSEDFFVSIGLPQMPETFWKESVLVKPDDREIVCHASAWDFQNGKDFRIKQCTVVEETNFFVAHHEMGHIEYYLKYKDQPFVFRAGANHGFHEAIGDLITLSAKSAKHLKRLNLISSNVDDPEVLLNNLYSMGMSKIAFLPFGYLMDLWRWDIFAGKTSFDNYNCKWWELREKYQGIEPPVNRSESDFDAAGKYHIVANTPYISYFVSFIIQFQFHRALCEKAGEYDPSDIKKPLYTCDIYNNKEAGELLGKMLAMGSSKPWPEAFHVMTGQSNMDASALLEYFKPLQSWLEKENEKNGVFVGWEKSNKGCSSEKQGLRHV